MANRQRIHRFLNSENLALINIVLITVIAVGAILELCFAYCYIYNPPEPDLCYQTVKPFVIGNKVITPIMIKNAGPTAEEVILSIRSPPAEIDYLVVYSPEFYEKEEKNKNHPHFSFKRINEGKTTVVVIVAPGWYDHEIDLTYKEGIGREC